MDTKLTLLLNADIITKAKKYAESKGLSLSRFTELFYERITNSNYRILEEFPISDWVMELAEGEAEYRKMPVSNQELREDWHQNHASKNSALNPYSYKEETNWGIMEVAEAEVEYGKYPVSNKELREEQHQNHASKNSTPKPYSYKKKAKAK
jgi:hypothetical protein